MRTDQKLKTIKSIPKAKSKKEVVNLLKERYADKANWSKKAFIHNVMQATGRSEQTVYRWINGGKPSLAEQKIIANELGERQPDLFNHLTT